MIALHARSRSRGSDGDMSLTANQGGGHVTEPRSRLETVAKSLSAELRRPKSAAPIPFSSVRCVVASVSSLPLTGCNPHAPRHHGDGCVSVSRAGLGSWCAAEHLNPTAQISAPSKAPSASGSPHSGVAINPRHSIISKSPKIRVALQAPGEHKGQQGATCLLHARRNAPAGTPRESGESVRCVLSNGASSCVQMNRLSPLWQGECGEGRCTTVQWIAPRTNMSLRHGRFGPARQQRTGLPPQAFSRAWRSTGSRAKCLPPASSPSSDVSNEGRAA